MSEILKGIVKLKNRWAACCSSVSPKETRTLLDLFVDEFVNLTVSWSGHTIKQRFGVTIDIARAVAWQLTQDIASFTAESTGHSGVRKSYDYLSGHIENGRGAKLIIALAILLRDEDNVDCIPRLVSIIANFLDVSLTGRNRKATDNQNDDVDNTEDGSSDDDLFKARFATVHLFFSAVHEAIENTAVSLEGTHDSILKALNPPFDGSTLSLLLLMIFHDLVVTHRMANNPTISREFLKARTLGVILGGLSHHNLATTQSTECPPELLMSHRMIIRVLAVLVTSAAQSKGGLPLLRGAQFLPKILSLLENPSDFHMQVALELVQFVLGCLSLTGNNSPELLEDFDQCDGHAIIGRHLLYGCTHGDEPFPTAFLDVVKLLVFIGPAVDAVEGSNRDPDNTSRVRNPAAFSILVDTFQKCDNSAVRSKILTVMSSIYASHPENYSRILPNDPFRPLLLPFDRLGVDLQHSVLHMIEFLLSKRVALGRELRLCVTLLDLPRPGVVLLVMRWFVHILRNGFASGGQLRTAGLFNTLIDYSKPVHDVKCVQPFVRDSPRLSKEEVRDIVMAWNLVKHELSESTDENKESDAESEMSLEFNTSLGMFNSSDSIHAFSVAEPDSNCNADDIEVIQEAGGVGTVVAAVGYAVATEALRLSYEFVCDSDINQSMFKDRDGLLRLYSCLPDPILRRPALHVVTALAVGDTRQDWNIIPDTIALLQSTGGSSSLDTSALRLRIDILNSLKRVFWRNEEAKVSFRQHGGFVWTVSVLDGLGKAIENDEMYLLSPDPARRKLVMTFVVALLHVLSAALSAHSENQKYFREAIGFGTLTAPLQTCRLLEGDNANMGCDALIDISVRGTWPVRCHSDACNANSILNDCYEREVEREKRAFNVYVVPEECVDVRQTLLCSKCQRSFTVENPGAAAVLLILLGRTTTVKPDIAVRAFTDMIALANVSSENRTRFTAIEFTAHVIGNLRDIPSDSYDYEPLLLSLAECLSKHSMSYREMRRALSLCAARNFPVSLLDMLVSVFKGSGTTSHYVDLRSSDDRTGIVELPILGELLWPPIHGYSFSTWFYIDSFGEQGVARSTVTLLRMACAWPERRQFIIRILHGSINVVWDCAGGGAGVSGGKTGARDAAEFQGVYIKEKRWYHLCLSHQRARNQKQGILTAFLNGVSVGSVELLYPYPVYSTKIAGQLAGTTGALPEQGKAESDTSENLLTENDEQFCPFLSWRLGNTWLFEDMMSEKDASLLFSLGAEFIGSLDGDLSRFQTTEAITPETAHIFASDPVPLFDFSRGPIGHLASAVLFAFRARNGIVAQCIRNPSARVATATTSTGPKQKSTVLVPVHAHLRNFALPRHTRPAKDVAMNVGGMSAFLYLAAQSTDRGSMAQVKTIELIRSLLEHSAQCQSDMRRLDGYAIMSSLLRDSRWVLGNNLLFHLFGMVGLKKSLHTFSNGVISNTNALENIILDWRIWSRASVDIQVLVLNSLADAFGEGSELSEEKQFNLRLAQSTRCLSRVMQLLVDFSGQIDSHGSVLLTPFRRLVVGLLHRPPSAEDVENLLTFVLLTHTVTPGVVHNIKTSSSQSTSVRSIVLEILLEMLLAADIPKDMAIPVDEDDNIESRPFFGPNGAGDDDQNVLDYWNHLCPVETLVSLPGCDSIADRTTLVKIVEASLQHPAVWFKFEKSQGFTLIGQSLSRFPGSRELVEAVAYMLFDLKKGQSFLIDDDLDKPSHPVLELKHSGAILTLLWLAKRIYQDDRNLFASVLNSLRLVCVGSSATIEALLSNQGIQFICEMLPTAMSDQKSEGVAESGSILTEMAPVMSLLNELISYGFRHKSIASNIIDSALSAVQNLSLPESVKWQIRVQVLEEAIRLFFDVEPSDSSAEAKNTISCLEKVCYYCVDAASFWLKATNVSEELEQKAEPEEPAFMDEENSPRNPLEKEPWEVVESADADHTLNARPSNDIEWLRDTDDKAIAFARTVLKHFSSIATKLAVQDEVPYGEPSTSKSVIDEPLCDLLVHLLSSGADQIPRTSLALRNLVDNSYFSKLLLENSTFATQILFHSFGLMECDDEFLQSSTRMIWTSALQSQRPFLREIVSMSSEMDSVSSTSKVVLDPKVASIVKSWAERNQSKYMKRSSNMNKQIERWREKQHRERAAFRVQSLRLGNLFIENHQKNMRANYERIQFVLQADASVKTRWKSIICDVTHERAVWGQPLLLAWGSAAYSTPPLDGSRVQLDAESVPKPQIVSYELDPTEGPDRQRIRLRRIVFVRENCFPAVLRHVSDGDSSSSCIVESNSDESKVLRTSTSLQTPDGYIHVSQPNEEPNAVGDRDSPGPVAMGRGRKGLLMLPGVVTAEEHVSYTARSSRITPFHKRNGEFLLSQKRVYFVYDTSLDEEDASSEPLTGSERCGSFSCTYTDIHEIHRRRYLLTNNAMEIFCLSGETYLLAFESQSEREIVLKKLISSGLPNFVDYEDAAQGTLLRKSITQRWQEGLVSNFEYLMHLNTLSGRSFNDITQYPVYPWVLRDYSGTRLDLDDHRIYRDFSLPMGAQDPSRLEKFIEKYNTIEEMKLEDQPYFYGSHYSNIGTVLHYLVRLRPFADYFRCFQGGKFDIADRLFYSVGKAWHLASSGSASDVKECIPEFFYLPEFLENRNAFELGIKQDGLKVDDVVLPPWAHGSARMFVELNRAALESDYVSAHLHEWIDLVFGYKQRGEEAKKAFNIFHPLTYEGAVDPDLIADHIKKEATITQISNYGQTPAQLFKKAHPPRRPIPTPPYIHTHSTHLSGVVERTINEAVGHIDMIDGNLTVLGAKKILIKAKKNQFLSWGHWDQSMRICALDTGKVHSVVDAMPDDDVLCAGITAKGNTFVTGGTSSVVKFWSLDDGHRVRLRTTLHGHGAAVLSLAVCSEWSIVCTGSVDRTCIIWDLNKPYYVRTLSGHEGPVTCLSVSPRGGEIVTYCRSSGNRGVMRLWSINGDLILKKSLKEIVDSVCFSMDTSGNIIAGGLKNGQIAIWDSKLETITTLQGHSASVTTLFISNDNTVLYSGDSNGNVFKFKVLSKERLNTGSSGRSEGMVTMINKTDIIMT